MILSTRIKQTWLDYLDCIFEITHINIIFFQSQWFVKTVSLPRRDYGNVKTNSSEVPASGAGCLRTELLHPRILGLQALAMHKEKVGSQQILLRHHHP